MEEFRENKIRERAQRVIKKQNRINKNVEKIKAIEKSNISNIQNDENSNTNRNYDNSQTGLECTEAQCALDKIKEMIGEDSNEEK